MQFTRIIHEDPSLSATDQALRDDVRLLGTMLGEVIVEQAGQQVFERVETARMAARRRRTGDAGAEADLVAALSDLTPLQANDLVRAFSAYFNVVNLAEQVHRLRRRREYLKRGPQPGSLAAAVAELKAHGCTLEHVRTLLGQMRLMPVFTAHPTEAVRRTLLFKQQRIAEALIARIDPDRLTPNENAQALNRIRNEVTVAWQTEEHFDQRPQVADEVEHVMFHLTEVVYHVVPAFYESLAEALKLHYGPHAADGHVGGILRFGSWVGGDMDGNPNVGAETIRATLDRHRDLVLRLYRRELSELFESMSHSQSRVAVDGEVLARIDHYRQQMPTTYDEIPVRYRSMPYRVLLALMAARLDRTLQHADHGYHRASELLDDLWVIDQSLAHHRGTHAGRDRIRHLIWRVETFGFHLATLDVRQDSDLHRRVAGKLLGDPDFAQRPAHDRAQRLTNALRQAQMPPVPDDPEVARALAVMQAIRDARQTHGPEAIGPYIISMTQGLDDALALLFVARCGGLCEADGRVPLDVAPLFEMVDDLNHSRETLAQFFSDPIYQDHLAARANHQHVMIGYSDSNKDSGLAASRWALYRAQLEMVHVVDQANVAMTLFHGRGGSVSRGGSTTRDAVLAQPPKALRGRFRVTEQGEIIHAKYGLRDIAARTLELIGGAVLEFSSREADAQPVNPAFMLMMDVIALESRRVYRQFVDDPEMYPYFQMATPIDVIQRLQISSRPASRRQQKGIADLRAIPWVFAWTQCRHIVPGWYGLGSGLAKAVERFGTSALQDMAKGWPFFATLLSDAAMVLAKADMPIAARYATLAGDIGARLFPRIQAEFERTVTHVLAIQGTSELLEREPALKTAIRLRNPYVDPMSFLQVDLLRRWRATGRNDSDLEQALFTTVRGIARGLQNTG